MKFVWGSVDHQKDLFIRLGYNPNDYDPNDNESVNKLFRVAIEAQLSGRDKNGNQLTLDDFALLHIITGR